MAYATPTTLSEFNALIAQIEWPENCNEQGAAMIKILEILSALREGWKALSPIRLYVASDTPPGLADWESAWKDKGLELPISGNVIGIWETLTITPKDGGQYVWIENDMRPTLARWFNGSTEFFQTTPDMYTNTLALSTTYLPLISQPLTLRRPAYVEGHYAYAAMDTASNFVWRSSLDGATDSRSRLMTDFPWSAFMKPMYIHFYWPTPLSSQTLLFYFKVVSGSGFRLDFKNAAGTRKFESGFMTRATDWEGYLGEISALHTEAIYLA